MGMLGFFLNGGWECKNQGIRNPIIFPRFPMIFPWFQGDNGKLFHQLPISQRQRQVCAADWSPSGLLSRVAEGSFHALIDTGETWG